MNIWKDFWSEIDSDIFTIIIDILNLLTKKRVFVTYIEELGDHTLFSLYEYLKKSADQ